MTHARALIAVTVGLVTVGFAAGTLPATPAQARERTRAHTTRAAAAAAPAAASVTFPAPTPRVRRALSIPSPVCTVAGWFSGLAGTLCSVARKGGELLSAGGKLAGGAATAAKVVTVAAVLAGLSGWVTSAARAVLAETATVIGSTTRPQLKSSWFSSSYWRMAAIGMLLTIPFLFAACVQGLLRSDPSLIGRAALGYLPLAVLGISIAAPLTTLLLSASDGLSALIAGAAGEAPGVALAKLGGGTALFAVATRSTFIAFVIGFVTVAATLTLWVELLIRAAAVYVIVLMLPVVFAALVWPARRVWAIRSVETLVALILAKFAIVAVLSLGGAAIGHSGYPGPAAALVGVTLVMLAAFSPWALLRLLPLHELASGVAGLSPGLNRPMAMLDRPAPPALADRSGAADSDPDAGNDDAARQIMGELNAGRATSGDADEPPGDRTAVGEAASGGQNETGAPEAADSVTTGTETAAEAGPHGGREGPGGSGARSGLVTFDESEARGGAGAADAETAADDRERLPGMGPRWQMKNDSWNTLPLGPEMLTEDARTASDPASDALPTSGEGTTSAAPQHPLGPVDRRPDPGAGES